MKPGLTEKQKRFVDYYIETGNATEAAKKAGYSEKTAFIIGHDNLRKPNIKTAIDARLKELESTRIADAKEVMQHLTAALRGEIEEEIPVVEGHGDGISEARIIKKQISAHDRLRAAELLMKRYGLSMSDIEQEEKKARTEGLKKRINADKLEVTGKDGAPLAAAPSVQIYLPDNGR